MGFFVLTGQCHHESYGYIYKVIFALHLIFHFIERSLKDLLFQFCKQNQWFPPIRVKIVGCQDVSLKGMDPLVIRIIVSFLILIKKCFLQDWIGDREYTDKSISISYSQIHLPRLANLSLSIDIVLALTISLCVITLTCSFSRNIEYFSSFKFIFI